MKPIVLFLLLMLVACASPPEKIHGTGKEVVGPHGWYEYCIRHPEDKDCG